MRRLLPVAALLAVAAVLAIGAALLWPTSEPTVAERADALARELRCPDCQGLSVADSPTESAAEIRRQIDALLASGASPDDVRAHFVARYGEWILLAPARAELWVIPLAAVAAAAAGLLIWRARSRTAVPAARPPADVRRRLHDEAEALDA